MTSIIFDATTYRNASNEFGVGLLPAPRPRVDRDELGNRIPVMPYSAADLASEAARLQALMDQQSREAEAAQQAEWDDTIHEMAAERDAIEEIERRYGRSYARAY